MKNIEGAKQYDPESLFVGYALGRKGASIKASEVLDALDVHDLEAKKDLEQRMQNAEVAVQIARENSGWSV